MARNRVLQIGAGGAGAAVAHALLDLDAETLFICDTDADRAAGLAARMKRDGKSVLVADTPLDVLGEVDGIVNATPIGMAKYPGVPLDPEKIASAQWVADIVYFPRTTELIARAAERGCPTLPGPGMAIFQAVKAFELFTGNAPSVDAMSRTFQAEA